MLRREIKGTRDHQVFSIEGTPAIRYSRTTENKPVGKKKKWIYNPNDKKEKNAKTF